MAQRVHCLFDGSHSWGIIWPQQVKIILSKFGIGMVKWRKKYSFQGNLSFVDFIFILSLFRVPDIKSRLN